MEKRYIFDYYYGAEAEQFSFFRVPKILFKEKKFKNISTDAKVLYGMMIDRMSLSRQNNWIDEQNRVYIIYTLSDIMEDLDCGKDKGVHLIAELDERGIGLIERRKQGFGKPALIYVKNFISCIEQDDHEDKDVVPEEEIEENFSSVFFEGEEEETAQRLENSGFCQTSEKPKSLGAECRSRDFGKTEVMTSEKPKSRGRKNRSLVVGKTEANDTNINNTDISDTNINNTYIDSPPLSPPPKESVGENGEEGLGEQNTEAKVYEYIKRTIEFDKCTYKMKTEAEKKQVKFLLDLICDVVAHPRAQIRIGGKDLPYQHVREKFLKLTAEQVVYVVKILQEAASRLTNPSSYALTALYNAESYATFVPVEEERPVPVQFEKFWDIFPLKVRKNEAENEYVNLIAGDVPEEELVEAAKNYAQEIFILQKEKACYPSNFLARGIYKDYVPGKYTPPKKTTMQLARGQERSYSEEEFKALEDVLLSTPVTH